MKVNSMKSKILIILFIFFIVLVIVGYAVYKYRAKIMESQKINNEYKKYYNIQVLGNELISIINKTIDINEKYEIAKNEKGHYIQNDTNSIKIYINLKYKDDYKNIEMENISESGIENFMKVYGAASFKCTELTYHEKTNNVKDITFTEIED